MAVSDTNHEKKGGGHGFIHARKVVTVIDGRLVDARIRIYCPHLQIQGGVAQRTANYGTWLTTTALAHSIALERK